MGCLIGETEPDINDVRVGVLLGFDHYWECVTGKVERFSGESTAVETMSRLHGQAL